jgi:undecaprenyl-diphosphatase
VHDYFLSFLLGIVEGLTEFLPVSSTAHLRIAEAMMQIDLKDAYWQMYTVVIQLGAILALLLIYLDRIVGFFRTFPKGEHGNSSVWGHPLTLTFTAFVVTAIPSLLLGKLIKHDLESLTIMAWALLIGGVVMWIIDAVASRREPSVNHVEDMNIFHAIWIGLWQTTSAVIPGTSRSMSTIVSGQAAGLSRPTALEFSFLVSIPTMIAATGYSLLKVMHPKNIPGAEVVAPLVITSHGWVTLAIGLVVSFFVALLVVEWFLHWVRHHGFTIFAIYRILLGIGLLVWGIKYLGQ